MSRHFARLAYILCNHWDEYGRRCKAFILTQPQRDPVSGGAVLSGYLDATEAAR